MKLKVYRLKGSKLEFVAFREPKEGDCIVESESKVSESFSIDLVESVRELIPEGKRELIESWHQLHPEWTAKQIAIAIQGR